MSLTLPFTLAKQILKRKFSTNGNQFTKFEHHCVQLDSYFGRYVYCIDRTVRWVKPARKPQTLNTREWESHYSQPSSLLLNVNPIAEMRNIFDWRQCIVQKNLRWILRGSTERKRTKRTRISSIRNKTVFADLCIDAIVLFLRHGIRQKMNNCNRFLCCYAHAFVVLCDVRYLFLLWLFLSLSLFWSPAHFDCHFINFNVSQSFQLLLRC